MISPSGPRLAGALGTSLLSLSMSVPGGYAALENTWEVVVDQAEKSGRDEPDRKDWRVLAIVHLADTRDQAIDDCTYGLQDFANYFGAAGFVPLSNSVEGTPVAARVRRGVCGQGQLLHRHTGRRGRLHPGPARAVRRVRHPAAARPRLGVAAGDVPLLRAVRPRGHAALQGPADGAAGVARLGQGHARPTARPRGRGHRQGDHRAHRRTRRRNAEEQDS